MERNRLIHHGVKGQKWGVRRYQNPDGTLTNAGKIRYNKKFKSVEFDTNKVDDIIKTFSNKEQYYYWDNEND